MAQNVALLFCSGEGQSDTHAETVPDKASGKRKPNPHPRAGQPYDGMDARAIVGLVENPQCVPKERALWIIPSSYLGHDARDHAAQREHGLFYFLPLDVDENNLDLSDVDEALLAACGDVTRLIYSTKSATADNRKWRALVPLKDPIPGRDYTDTVQAFNALLAEASQGVVIADTAPSRPGQFLYLPNRGEFYESKMHRKTRLDLSPSHPIFQRREEDRAKREQAQAEARRRAQERAKAQPAEKGSVIDAFNQNNAIETMLELCGYTRAGRSNDWRSRYQTSGSYATRDCGDHWISLSGSDDAAGIGKRSAGGARFGDAFDLFTHYHHGGSFDSAIKAAAAELGMDYASQRPERSEQGTVGCDDLPLPEYAPEDFERGEPVNDAHHAPGPAPKSDDDVVDLWGCFPAPRLPAGLMPAIIEEFACVQGEMMGADPAGIAAAALGACAAAIPDRIKLQVKRHDPYWLESARIWVALVGSPSTKKSPIISAATGPICKIDGELFRQWKRAQADYDALSKDEKAGIPPPAMVRLRISDTTVEAAQQVLESSVDGVLMIQDELSGWFGSMDRYNSGKGSSADRSFWLQAFNGGEFVVNRVARGAGIIRNLSVSMVGGIQPEPMRKVAADAADDGLLQRMFPIVLRPATKGMDAPVPDVGRRYAALIEALRGMQASPLGPLQFSDEAREIRSDIEDKHLEWQASEVISRKLASHIGKYDGLFARLCIVWHCVEAAGAGHLPPVISGATARRVADFLHQFLLRHAVAFYGGVLGLSDDHERMQAIAGYILSRKLEVVTNRDVQRGDRTMRQIKEHDIRPIMEQLSALGWVEQVPGPRPSSGTRWMVNPAVHRLFADRAEKEAQRRAEAKEAAKFLFGGPDQ